MTDNLKSISRAVKIKDIKRGDRLSRSWNGTFNGSEYTQSEYYDVIYVNYSDKEALIRFGNIEKIIAESDLSEFNFKKL